MSLLVCFNMSLSLGIFVKTGPAHFTNISIFFFYDSLTNYVQREIKKVKTGIFHIPVKSQGQR